MLVSLPLLDTLGTTASCSIGAGAGVGTGGGSNGTGCGCSAGAGGGGGGGGGGAGGGCSTTGVVCIGGGGGKLISRLSASNSCFDFLIRTLSKISIFRLGGIPGILSVVSWPPVAGPISIFLSSRIGGGRDVEDDDSALEDEEDLWSE